MEDYEHYADSKKKVPEFEVTTKSIMNRAQEKFDSGRDVADALRVLSDLGKDAWSPDASASAAEDEITSNRESRESREIELDCKGELADYHKYARESEKDLDEVRALLWGHCHMNLHESIESQNGFKGVIRSKLIEFLIATKRRALDLKESRA